MYKVGDKFVIEIGGEYPENPFENGENGKAPTMLYKIKGFNSLVFDENGLDRLEKAKNLERLAYDEGYSKAEKDYFKQTEVERESALQSGYEKGLYDAWEFWKKLQNIEIREDGASVAKNIFDCRDMVEVLRKYSPCEAIDKLKAWEAFQEIKKKCDGCPAWDGYDCSRTQEEDCLKSGEIKAGDVVKVTGDEILVTSVDDNCFDGVFIKGKHQALTSQPIREFHKTGKHIDLSEIFKGLEGEEK